MDDNQRIISVTKDYSKALPKIIGTVVLGIAGWVLSNSDIGGKVGGILSVIMLFTAAGLGWTVKLRSEYQCPECKKVNSVKHDKTTAKCSHCQTKYFFDWD